jgi:type I restriction enzyme S subunit
MEVRLGYRQTEVGVLPEDLGVVSLIDLAEHKRELFDDGDWVEAEFLTDQGIRLIQTGNIGEGEFVDKDIKKYISAESFKKLRCKDIQVGDILICRLAEPAGRACILRDIGEKRMITAVDVTIFRPPAGAADRRYLVNLFTTPRWFQTVTERCGGSTRTRISRGELGKISVPLPPLPEQRAIAITLSDADRLLDGLTQLIAKKRDLKKAAMQQLLTGQTRLPSFRGEWKVKTLGDLFSFAGGQSASRDQLSDEGHCYLHYGDIHGAVKTCVDTGADYQDIPKLDIPLKRVAPGSLLKDGDVVFVDASEDDEGTSRHVVIVNKGNIPFISGLHTIVGKSKTNELAHEYRRYCFQTAAIRQQFLFYAVGTKVSGISKTNICKLTLPVPSILEQTAIATVLSDVDAELAALEARRNKTRALKQAMMQELLTGRTRLVVEIPT